MGLTASENNILYNVFCTNKKEGETPVMRHPKLVGRELAKVNSYGVQTTWEALESNIKKGKGKRDFIGYRKRIKKEEYEKKYTWITYQEAYEITKNFAKGAQKLKLSPEFHSEDNGEFKFMGIYSKNRWEWYLTFLASHADSVTIVTIYDTLGDKAMEFIFNQTKLETILIESCSLKKILFLKKQNKTGNLKNLIVIEGEDEQEALKELENLGMTIYTFDQIVQQGKDSPDIVLTPPKPETICTICYTSGTTGNPKGAMISHGALEATIDCMDRTGMSVFDDDIYFSFLPYAHIMECLIGTLLMTQGKRFGIFSGSMKRLIEDTQCLKPTIMCAVPRVFQRVYEGIMKKIKEKSYITQRIFNKAISLKIKDFQETGILSNLFLDNLIFKQIRDLLGGRMRFMLVGSAPLDPYLHAFMQCCLTCKIVEGYGQTEDCAGVLITSQYDRVGSHLGGPGWVNEIKLVDVPDLDYLSTDRDPETFKSVPRGELCIRGPLLFSGYLNDIENTKQAIDENGWLHTGDIAMILTDHGNAVRIIDRKKNIFKLQQGEYVAPEKLENILMDCKYIEQIFVHGETSQNYLVAIITPRVDSVINFFKKNGKDNVNKDNYKEYLEDKDLKDEILKDMAELGRKSDFKGFEIIKKIYLFPDGFNAENDLGTPTLKIRRHEAKKRFANEIKKMYSE